jgi:hypothetical protein
LSTAIAGFAKLQEGKGVLQDQFLKHFDLPKELCLQIWLCAIPDQGRIIDRYNLRPHFLSFFLVLRHHVLPRSVTGSLEAGRRLSGHGRLLATEKFQSLLASYLRKRKVHLEAGYSEKDSSKAQSSAVQGPFGYSPKVGF